MQNKPFKTYTGGKNGSGVYQAIINQIPPHEPFISGFAGNCGVIANKRPALANIAIDLDAAVVDGWKNIPGIIAIMGDTTRCLGNVLKRYHTTEKDGVFVFLDPPYLMEVRSSKKNYYSHEMTDIASHKKMLAAAINLKCNCAVIHYPCDLYNEMLKDWRYIDINGRTRQGMRIERLYMNYPEPTSLHDYQYIGKDFRERELFKKSKKNIINKFSTMPPLERNYIIDALTQKKLL